MHPAALFPDLLEPPPSPSRPQPFAAGKDLLSRLHSVIAVSSDRQRHCRIARVFRISATAESFHAANKAIDPVIGRLGSSGMYECVYYLPPVSLVWICARRRPVSVALVSNDPNRFSGSRPILYPNKCFNRVRASLSNSTQSGDHVRGPPISFQYCCHVCQPQMLPTMTASLVLLNQPCYKVR